MAGEIFDYFAFISYSHADKETAQKLQKRLERYHMPAKLLQAHPDLPKKLSPIFRDESDISGKGTLIETLHDNLRRSQYLILICSPSSAKSEYVNDEVDYFINELHREDRIIPLIVGGIPRSKDESIECFPPAILALDREREPLGIDLKTFGRDGAFLRVIAAMLRLNFTYFKSREDEERKRRLKIFGAVAAVFAVIAWYSFDLFYEVTYNDESLLSIANSYYYSMDYDNAKKWFERAARRGNSEAQCNLGKMYQNGEGVDKDYYKAMEWLGKAAASAGSRFTKRDADYAIAEIYIDVFGEEGAAERDKEWHKRTFADGLPAVQCAVARMYEEGNGVDQNYAKAMEWYLRAAAKENDSAQCAIANMYEQGLGVERDYVKAKEWYEKAAGNANHGAQEIVKVMDEMIILVKQADSGDIEAMNNIADIYYEAKDYSDAIAWYEKAAALGNSDAQYNLGTMYEEGNGVKRNYAKAREWYEKSAAQNYADAQYSLGIMYEEGNGVKRNYAKAREWYEKAAAQEHADALNSLGIMYEEGTGVKQNYTKARKFYEKSAALGNSDAQYNLGTMYEEGNGVKRNYAKAREWYEKAAAQGEAEAQYSLGVIYRDGLGMPKDEKKAVEWFAKAAEQNHDDASRELKALSDY